MVGHCAMRIVVPESAEVPVLRAIEQPSRTMLFLGETLSCAVVLSNPGYTFQADVELWQSRFQRLRLLASLRPIVRNTPWYASR